MAFRTRNYFLIGIIFVILSFVSLVFSPRPTQTQTTDLYTVLISNEFSNIENIRMVTKGGFREEETIQMSADEYEEIYDLIQTTLVPQSRDRVMSDYSYLLFIDYVDGSSIKINLLFDHNYLVLLIGNRSLEAPELYQWLKEKGLVLY